MYVHVLSLEAIIKICIVILQCVKHCMEKSDIYALFLPKGIYFVLHVCISIILSPLLYKIGMLSSSHSCLLFLHERITLMYSNCELWNPLTCHVYPCCSMKMSIIILFCADVF